MCICSMFATPQKVISMIEEPESMNPVEQRVYTYLLQMVGNMTQHEVSAFLRFVSGSSVCLEKKITVAFNNLSGLGRRPISHHIHVIACWNSHSHTLVILIFSMSSRVFFLTLNTLGAWMPCSWIPNSTNWRDSHLHYIILHPYVFTINLLLLYLCIMCRILCQLKSFFFLSVECHRGQSCDCGIGLQ